MSLTNVLFRINQGTLAAPATADLKQVTIDVGTDPVTTADNTRLTYKDTAGTDHIFITKEEIEVLITAGIPVSSGVYVVPANYDEYIDLLELDQVINIWCEGIVADSNKNIMPVSSKNIFGPNNNDAMLAANNSLTLETFDTNWIFPGSGTAEVEIRFFTDVNNTGATWGMSGGFVEPPSYKIQLKGMNVPILNLSVDAFAEFEFNRSTTTDITSSGVDLVMWSGNRVGGRKNQNTNVFKSEEIAGIQQNKFGNEVGFNLDITTDTSSDDIANISARLGEMKLGEIKFINSSTPIWSLTIGGDDIITWDADGNTSHNGATIQADLDSNYIQEFHLGGRVVATHTTTGEVFDMVNVYRRAGFWTFIAAGFGTARVQSLDTIEERVSPAAGTPGSTFMSWNTVKLTDTDGNIAYNGATIPSSLSSDYIYNFYPESCTIYKKSGGTTYHAVNVYLDGSVVWKSIKNTGLTCSFTVISTSAFLIRKSTLISTAADQTMVMTVLIVPS